MGILHGLQKIPLFGSRQIGQLHSGIEGYLLLVYQVQKFRDEVGETDEALDVASTITRFSRNQVTRLVANLATS